MYGICGCLRRVGRRAGCDESAASAVEFALILPVFMLILTGTLCYGLYFGAAHSVQQLASEAARASVAGLSPDERRLIAERAIDTAKGKYTLIAGDSLDVAVSAHEDNADLYRVSISYDASNLPIWHFQGLLPLPPKTIERAAVVRRGGY